jgi:two-component system chemotaxis response regulator CheY
VKQALVVDDSKAMRTIIGRFLKGCGYDVAEAGDGREALQRLAELAGSSPPVSLVMVDWNMPEMNGLEFVQAARANADYREVKIVMVTTETEIERVCSALEAGADEYLMKPFNQEGLLDKLALLGLGSEDGSLAASW